MHALAAVRRDVRSQDSISRCKYLREFAEAFPKYDSLLTEEEIEGRVFSSNIVLVADYHALAASQQFAAELLEKCARKRPVILAVEAVLARDQHILDAWWRREISENELRRRLRFDRDWGYPWEPWYSLLCSARDHADGMYGLDCMPRDDLRQIRSRDRHAAAKIREIREKHPRALIFTVFGESHLAPQHLPRALRTLISEEKILSVLQNVDALYWQAIAEQPVGELKPVSIGEDTICVFNSSPLEKYESYRLCLERWKAADNEYEDFTPAVHNLTSSLARSLGFRLDAPHNGTQPKFLADLLPEVITLSEDSDTDDDEKTCCYQPESNAFLIREFHIAHAAEECARFLHLACRGMTTTCVQAMPVVEALGRFGARLLSHQLGSENTNSPLGDSLYEEYLSGKVSRADLRALFLAHLETPFQAEAVLHQINRLIQS